MPHTQKRKISATPPKRKSKPKKAGRPKRRGRRRIYRRYYGKQRRAVRRTGYVPPAHVSAQTRLDNYRGLKGVELAEERKLVGLEREELVAQLEAELDSELDLITPVPREEWTPRRLAIASGLSLAQITRVFHEDPRQQRWRHFVHDLKYQSAGCNMTADQMARVLALTPGHRYQQQSQGAMRLARAMDGIRVGELVEILLAEMGR